MSDSGRKRTVRKVSIQVNGVAHHDVVEPRLLLVNYIRDVLGLTGTHVGCDTTSCGACTLMMESDGRMRAVKSCTVFAVQADGRRILTIEGVSRGGSMHQIQNAFSEKHALQCGYCTPGMVIAALEILQRNTNPTEDEVRRGLSGNLCRCTSYQTIVEAVLAAAKHFEKTGKPVLEFEP